MPDRRRPALLALLLASTSVLSACDEQRDSLAPPTGAITIGYDDRPLARGATMAFPVAIAPPWTIPLDVRPLGEDGVLEASVRYVTEEVAEVAVHGLTAGEGELGFYLQGELVARQRIVVREVDRVLLFGDVPHEDLVATSSLSSLHVDVRGGATVWASLVADDDALLHGGRLLEVPADAAATVVHDEASDRLVILDPAPGEHLITLRALGREVGQLRVVGSSEAEIAALGLSADLEPHVAAGVRLCVAAVPHVASGDVVVAVPLAWRAGGVDAGMGDRVCYTFDPSAAPMTLEARVNGLQASRTIRGHELEVLVPGAPE